MFGHQDDHHDDQHHDDAFVPESTTDAAFAADMTHNDGGSAQDQPADDASNPALPADPAVFSPQQDAPSDDEPSHDDSQAAPTFEPYTGNDSQPAEEHTVDSPAESATAGGDSGDLLDIKTQALQQLSPLVGHLDQSPEEKFRTTMMMIQASDNQSLVKVAYEAAQQITDEKTKAQALLDIVNEINYFTHQQDGPKE